MNDRRVLGYAVVEFNQASRQPERIWDDQICDSLEDAREQAFEARRERSQSGRRETYAVVELVEVIGA